MTGAVIFGCQGLRLTPQEAAFFADAQPWGFILFKRNVQDTAQLRALTDSLRAVVGRDAPIFMDQEGGTVQRLRPPLARNWPDASSQPGGARAVWLRHRLMAAELRAVGVDGNCAPVIDVGGPATHPFLLRRIWSRDPVRVIELAQAAAQGLLDGGVLPVIKHLPGHGAANADSHVDLARCPAPLASLKAHDFLPVQAMAGQAAGMTSHVIYDALDPKTPATISPRVVSYLRTDLGFDGLLMTDDLNMEALGGSLAQRAERAVAAGCDVVLHCTGDLAEMQAVAGASGRLTGASVQRAQKAQNARGVPQPIDIDALAAEFDALT